MIDDTRLTFQQRIKRW